MPKVLVDDDWMEPLLHLTNYPLADEIELSDEEIVDLKETTRRFKEWQDKLKRLVDESRKRDATT